jgi:hypothetical protein
MRSLLAKATTLQWQRCATCSACTREQARESAPGSGATRSGEAAIPSVLCAIVAIPRFAHQVAGERAGRAASPTTVTRLREVLRVFGRAIA